MSLAEGAAAPLVGPFAGYEGEVEPGWIDINGHMNVVWYDKVFDIAETRLFAAFGIEDAYTRRTGRGTFRVEKRIRYERELLEGDRLRVESRIASPDGRVLRSTHELVNVTRGGRAGLAEFVSLHVDLSLRKASRIADTRVLSLLNAMAAAHARLPPPAPAR